MAVTVVDQFEFVDIDETQPGRLLGRLRLIRGNEPLAKLFKPLLESLAIQHAGQRIALTIIEQREVILEDAQQRADQLHVAPLEAANASDREQSDHVAIRFDGQHGARQAVGFGELNDLTLANALSPLREVAERGKNPRLIGWMRLDPGSALLDADMRGETSDALVIDQSQDTDRIRGNMIQNHFC